MIVGQAGRLAPPAAQRQDFEALGDAALAISGAISGAIGLAREGRCGAHASSLAEDGRRACQHAGEGLTAQIGDQR